MVFLDEQMWCVRNLFKGKQNVVNVVTFLTNNDRSLGHYQDIFFVLDIYILTQKIIHRGGVA